MLSDRDALFAAIRANPEEDTPRLMFADWLDEHGDADRAEFVRLQVERARLDDDASDSQAVYEFLRDRDYVTRPSADWTRIDAGIHRRIALAIRARDLLKRHAGEWLPKLPKKYEVEWGQVSDGEREGQSYDFHRGFAHRVVLNDPRKLGAGAERLRRATPAVTLVVRDLTTEVVDRLADAGLLGWIVGLEASGDSAAGLRALGHHREAAGVRALAVRYGASAETVSALADAPHWTGLRTLDLSHTTVYGPDAEALFRAPHLRGLRRLRVRVYDWPLGAVDALTAGGFTELVSLQIMGADLDDDAAERLSACPSFATLRTLDLGHSTITGRGVTALLCSPHLANVAFLGLEANPCGGVDTKRLAAAEPGGLRMLHAHGSRFRTPDVRALARCPRLRTLWYLDLDDNNLGTPAVRELVRGFKDFCPPIIWMTHNRIDDRGAELLARWEAAQVLDVLHLRFNRITDTGVRALLASPNLANLDSLGVDTADADLTARLRHRFRHHDDLTYY